LIETVVAEEHMSVSKEQLTEELRGREYREAYAEGFLNHTLTAQIRLIREQRGLSQRELAVKIGKHQPGLSRIEDSNYGKWNVATLRQVAGALDTWLQVSLEPYGKLVDAALEMSPEGLRRPTFEEDPVFVKPPGAEELLREEMVEGPTTELRRKLLPWLEEGQWSPQPLTDWLQGRNLVSYRHEDEPYRWFLRALPSDESKWNWHRRELTRRLARMIEEEPDVQKPGPRPDEFLSNLFLLAAGLAAPDLFAEPLYGVYRRLRRRSVELEVGVADCLLAALTRNQKDLRLYEVWLQMMEAGKHDILPGNEYAGFEGFKWLPPRPNFLEIARGIKLMEPVRPTLEAIDKLAGLMGSVVTEFASSNCLIGLLEGSISAGWGDAPVAALGSVAAAHHEYLDEFLNRSPAAEARAVADIVAKGLWYYGELLRHSSTEGSESKIVEMKLVRTRVLMFLAKAA
jgi:transcriptional regulator with XRE-family HTH domain